MSLQGKVALVAGATVYVTGRSTKGPCETIGEPGKPADATGYR